MPYKLSPYVRFIESHLRTDAVQYGVFHLLTGRVFEPSSRIRALLLAGKLGQRISLTVEDLPQLGDDGAQLQELIKEEFLVADGYDALMSFAHHYVVRPLQNPAVTYRAESGKTILVRLSMAERLFSPTIDQLSQVIEEEMPAAAARIFFAADGSRTLEEIAASEFAPGEMGISGTAFREAMDFLTKPERQLVKVTSQNAQLNEPNQPFNTVPRNFFHASRSPAGTRRKDAKALVDFHQQKIESADWEFDVIESTVNHAFRFPSEAIGGLSYGSRFCAVCLKPEVLPRLREPNRLNILEVGGGTGSFARAFLEQARSDGAKMNYHILDLAPALIENQQRLLADIDQPVVHFQQNATEMDIPGVEFDLIVANEVIADFPTAEVKRHQEGGSDVNDRASSPQWIGAGLEYIQKYELSIDDAPDYFLVNAGVFEFIERAWEHLVPGGELVVSEYGGEHEYPVEAFHLNHAEFSIHFGHVIECARKIGFQCRLQTLKDFLDIDDRVSVLNGRNEHIQCLNHVFEKYGASLEFRLISEREFNDRFKELATRINLRGYSFQPLANNFHYGPSVWHFMVLIMSKPK